MKRPVLPVLAVLASLAVPTFAMAQAKPKATAKPAAKATATPKKAAATPAPTSSEPATASAERELGAGAATLLVGKNQLKLEEVGGSIQTSSGFQIAALKFTDGKSRLQIDLMYTGTGVIEPGYLTNLFFVDAEGNYSAHKKGVSSCTVTLTMATPSSVEGIASCPKGMVDMKDKPAKALMDVKFKAEAKP